MPASDREPPVRTTRTPGPPDAPDGSPGGGARSPRARTNEEWLRTLGSGGPEQAAALQELRDLILRVLLAYLGTHPPAPVPWSRDDAVQLAQDCTQETLLVILGKLRTFRGESRFTTWAYQVAIRVLLGDLRRRRWKDISLERGQIGDGLPAWPIGDARSPDPERALQQEQVWKILREVIEQDLTERQRSVLVAHVFQGMPLDEVAHWLGTNRDNVYKIIHDARRKLKKCLVERGLTRQEILNSFEGAG